MKELKDFYTFVKLWQNVAFIYLMDGKRKASEEAL